MSSLRPIPSRLRNAAIILACAAIGIGTYLVFSAPPEQEPVPAEQAELITLGKQVYTAQCAACHGANLEGQPNWRERKPDGKLPAPPHDETGHTWHHDDATLFALTKYGLSKLVGKPVPTDMPAYDGVLSDVQIRAVLAYIKSQWPEHIQKRQSEVTARAAAKN